MEKRTEDLVDATLRSWDEAFDGVSSASKRTRNTPRSADPLPIYQDREAFEERLGTFDTATYFAKPISLSPIVCAAFGWRNTDNDILQSGDSTLCIDFQPGLSSEARDQLVEQYYGKIVSETDLPFRNFAKRWTRAMSKCKLETTQSLIVEGSSAESVGKDISRMLSDKTAMTDVYVPPYLLPLSEEFIKLDDHTADGSQTKLIVEEDSLKIQQYLHSNSGGAQFEVRLPATVLNFCASLDPELDVDELLRQRKGDKLPYLLSTFGWSVDHVTSAEDDGIIVKCNVCNARARLAKAVSSQPQWKRRKADSDAHLRLIESHRVHCPYACGFSFGPGRKTELTGWQKVITCLIKS